MQMRSLVATLVVSALLTVFSESIYWYSGGTDYPGRTAYYLIPTIAFLWAATTWPVAGWPGVVLLGAVYGFVTEGVLTPVVYGGFPFDPFAISYTSLAWHGPVSVGFGLVVLHRVLAGRAIVRPVALLALAGVAWGVWAMSLRLPGADDEPASIAALVGPVEPRVFALYASVATAVVAVCHLLLGRAVRPRDLVPCRIWTRIMVVVGAIWFVVLIVPAAPWAPLELAVLLLVCRAGLRRLAGDGDTVAAQVCRTIPVRRLAVLVAMPATATATYAALVAADLDDATIRAVCLNGVVWLQTIVGWALFVAALIVARRRPRVREVPGVGASRSTWYVRPYRVPGRRRGTAVYAARCGRCSRARASALVASALAATRALRRLAARPCADRRRVARPGRLAGPRARRRSGHLGRCRA